MNHSPVSDWHRLVRYLTGEYTPEREEDLWAWIVEDEERGRLMDELKKIWEESGKTIASRDVDAAWDEVNEKIELETSSSGGERFGCNTTRESSPESDKSSRASSYRERNRSDRGWQLLLAGTAVGGLVVAVLFAVFFSHQSLFAPVDQNRVFTTKPGQRATVQLSDGTEVRLNVDTRLSLPKAFSSEERVVDLQGEAFFDVASDSTRPFVVQVDGATVEVLGTAFGVKAYAGDKERRVAVTEGKVHLRAEESEERAPVLLESRNLGVIAGRHVQAVRENVDLREQLAWREGQLIFKDAPFDEVVRKLERWYDIKIETRVNSDAVDRLNATFDDESTERTLTAVAAALDLEYRKDGRTVSFFRPERAPNDPR